MFLLKFHKLTDRVPILAAQGPFWVPFGSLFHKMMGPYWVLISKLTGPYIRGPIPVRAK